MPYLFNPVPSLQGGDAPRHSIRVTGLNGESYDLTYTDVMRYGDLEDGGVEYDTETLKRSPETIASLFGTSDTSSPQRMIALVSKGWERDVTWYNVPTDLFEQFPRGNTAPDEDTRLESMVNVYSRTLAVDGDTESHADRRYLEDSYVGEALGLAYKGLADPFWVGE